MFELPQGSSSAVDGQDDDHPIDLDKSGIQNAEFCHLLVFLYDQDEVVAPAPMEYFLSILKLSVLWRIPTAVKYVTNQLPTHPDFTPAIQIQLSRCRAHMGVVAFYKLVQLKSTITEFKAALAFNPPDVHHSFSCIDENICSRLWESFWWGGYAKQLLHPDNTKPPAAILLEVDASKGILSHMPPACLQNTMDAIWEDNPFNHEQEQIEEASRAISEWMAALY
ncbi:hypothetical protein B0H17DRAFT_1151525 [Mycena rosella]|uniref:BTB domain-containing protein n=1 Tax=Mycena rosella TaxID=1033263 RepID=A0AAD7BJD9_MYCRO|nr:hypothetical protein B0H17DRAFT_1151525 [Mycena rosella]